MIKIGQCLFYKDNWYTVEDLAYFDGLSRFCCASRGELKIKFRELDGWIPASKVGGVY